MSIISQRTVGNVVYAQISEPYPLFSSSTNYVAINPTGRVFVNEPNSSSWFPMDKKRYSDMQSWNNATSLAFTVSNNGVYFFFGSATFAPTATTLNGFTRTSTPGATAIILSADSNNIGRYLVTGLIGMYVTATNQYDQMPFECLPTLNNNSNILTVAAPLTGQTWGAGTDCAPDIANGEMTSYANRIFDIDGNAGNFIKIAGRVYSDGLTTWGTYGCRHYKLLATMIEEPTMLMYENFEDGLDRWNYANENQTNRWIIGSGTSYEGNYSAYITTGSSVNSPNTYSATTTSVSHLWTDIDFPVGTLPFGSIPYYLSFRWRSSGDSTDFGRVYLTPTSYTPTGGTIVDSIYRLGNTTYSGISSGYTTSKILFTGLSTDIQTVFNETWETGSITGDTGGWTVANGGTNAWTVGTATASGGTYSAYISNDGGTSNAYTNTVAQVSHIYRDITIPSSATSAMLQFNWRAVGENAAGATQYDYGAVVIANTGTTPAAGTEVSTTKAAPGGNGRIGATTNLGKFNLNYIAGGNWNTEVIDMSAYIGQTKRLVFTWANDTSLGVNPPMAIDNISLTYESMSDLTLDADGYAKNRLVFSWVNNNSGAANPPMSVDNIAVYCYPSTKNDKI